MSTRPREKSEEEQIEELVKNIKEDNLLISQEMENTKVFERMRGTIKRQTNISRDIQTAVPKLEFTLVAIEKKRMI